MRFIKKISILSLLLSVITVSGCKKSSNPISYSVNGLTDIPVEQYSDTTFPVAISVALISGNQEVVTLTPTNLPTGVTVSPACISGTPSFANYFTFHVNVDTAGTLPIQIVATTASGNKRTFAFNLDVSPNPNCILGLVNGAAWKSVLTIASSGIATVVDSGTASVSTAYSTYINSTNSGGGITYTTSLHVVMDCSSGTSQIFDDGFNFTGSNGYYGEFNFPAPAGSFSGNYISNTFVVSNSSSSVPGHQVDNCTLVLYR